MKILAICGSPRKGNTFSALKTIKEGFPDIDIEILMHCSISNFFPD